MYKNCWYLRVPLFHPSQFLHHGTTVLHFEPETMQMVPVFLKLERCNGTITWCRPPWNDKRRGSTGSTSSYLDGGSTGGGGGTSGIGSDSVGGGLSPGSPPATVTTCAIDTIEDSVSPGLRLKYANRTGESLVSACELR